MSTDSLDSLTSMSDGQLISSWVSFLALVRFDDKDGQNIQCIYPNIKKSNPDSKFLQDLKMLCMPDCLESDNIHELVFMTRIRDKDNTNDKNSDSEGVHNCFVSFRQYPDPASRRGYFQQSLVLVSKYPYLSLFNKVLNRLAEVLSDIPIFEKIDCKEEEFVSSSSNYLPSDLTILDSTIEVAYQHFLQWPEPTTGKTLRLPFFGIMIQYEVPTIPMYSLREPRLIDVSSLQGLLSKPGVDSQGGLYNNINLVAVFHRLGLLPHLWSLWELVITGKNVVVWSSSAAISSAVVAALVSLISPLSYAGDYRPYINPYDSDFNLLGNITSSLQKTFEPKSGSSRYLCLSGSSRKNVHYESGFGDRELMFSGPIYIKSIGSDESPQSIIVGITNPFLLKSFAHADAALFIPNPDSSKPKKHSRSLSAMARRPKIASLFKSSTALSGIFGPMSQSTKVNDIEPPNSPTDTCKPSKKFSALGIGLNDIMNKESPQSPKSSDTSESMLSVRVKKLSLDESIGDAYDNWCALGGSKPHGSNRHVLLCIRSKPMIQMDSDVMTRLNAVLSPSTTLPSDIHHRFEANNIQRGRDSITDEPSDKTVIGNMMLREHFRSLTLSMLKPLEMLFQTNTARRPTASLMLSSSSSSSRAGASSLLLYSNPNQYFSTNDAEEAIGECHKNAEMFGYNHIPPALRNCSEWDTLVLRFAESDNFKAFSRWRRDLLVIRMLVETSRLCYGMSTNELIRAFAIEQGVQILTEKLLSELVTRIKATIRALEFVNEKFHNIALALTSHESGSPKDVHSESKSQEQFDIPSMVIVMKNHLSDIIAVVDSNKQFKIET